MKNRLAVVLSVLLLAGLFHRATPSGASGDGWRDAPRGAAEALGVSGDNSAVPPPSAPRTPNKSVQELWAGDDSLVNSPTPAQRAEMASHNKGLRSAMKGLELPAEPPVYRPFADYEPTGYLIMNSKFNFNSAEAKTAAAKTLGPEGVLVLVFSPYDYGQKESLVAAYSAVIPRERIKAVSVPDADNAFWARDAMPVPVFEKKTGAFAVINARYYHNFNSDDRIAALFGAKMESHDYYYEGGNFMANDKGLCLMVNNKMHSTMPDAVFSRYYGCEKVVRLPHLDGIGHVDEHARFVSADTVVTDLDEYKAPLAAAGLKVAMMPRVPNTRYSTHVNSLIIDGKVAMPAYGKGTDDQAKAVYESLGLQVVPANTYTLSESGQGSIHCITMTYPKVPFKELLKALKGTEF